MEVRRCRRCGGPLSLESARGLCLRCLAVYTLREEPRGPFASPDRGKRRRFGDYELLERLGQGGMGIVYRARQLSLDRIVAIKMVLFGQFAGESARRRFRSEATLAARLQHPNIIAIHEVGELDGQPYFSMEFVPGRSLSELVQDRPMTARRAVQYLGKIARAIQHAHDHGILHRDLKPANVLIDEADEPRVTDFGLAKQMSSDGGLTLSGQVVGSPNFMPPEQARGGKTQTGAASDIYSLGGLLYYMLTARPPFAADSFEATLGLVLNADPIPPRHLNPSVPIDLETICLKCLEKDPDRRYRTASELAAELDRFVRREPIKARPLGLAARFWRWSLRKPALAGLIAAVVALLLTVAAVATVAAARIASERDAARLENYYRNIALADAHIGRGEIGRALGLLLDCPERYRHWEWGHLVFLCHQEIRTRPFEDGVTVGPREVLQEVSYYGRLRALLLDPVGSWAALVTREGMLRVWDARTGEERMSFGKDGFEVVWAKVSPEGGLLAVGLQGGELRLIETESWRERPRWEGTITQPGHFAFSSDGSTAAFLDANGVIRFQRTSDGLELRRFQAPLVEADEIRFVEDGKALIVQAGTRAVVQPISADLPARTIQADPSLIHRLFVDPRGESYVTVEHDGTVRLGPKDGPSIMLGRIRGTQQHEVHRVFFSNDGSKVCTGGEAGNARLWDTHTGGELLSLPTRVYTAQFVAGDTLLLTVGGNAEVHVWDARNGRLIRRLQGHDNIIELLASQAAGTLVLTADLSGVIKLWNLAPGRTELRERAWLWGTSYSPDGRRIVTAPWNCEFDIWDGSSGQRLLRVYTPQQIVHYSVFSPDGRLVVTAGDKIPRVWNSHTGDHLLALRGHTRRVAGVAWSPDGQQLATAGWDGTARIWDASSGAELHRLPHRQELVSWICFSPDGKQVATTGEDGLVIWDWKREKDLFRSETGRGGVRVEFSPDGRLLLVSGTDGTIHVFARADAVWRKSVWQSRGLAGTPSFSPDSSRCVIPMAHEMGLGMDRPSAEIRDARTGRRILTLEGHAEPINTAQFSPDGTRIVTGSFDHTVRQWESFPWRDRDYENFPGHTFRERLRAYADRYWDARLITEFGDADASEGAPTRVVPMRLDATMWPPREDRATAAQLDLTAHYNGFLDTAFAPVFQPTDVEMDLASLPQGLVTLNDITFDVRGVITLRRLDRRGGGSRLNWDRYPERVEAIGVSIPVRRLHLLHGAVGTAPEGTRIGRLVLSYAGGDREELEIVYGKEVLDWWEPPQGALELARPQPVWRGTNPRAVSMGASVRLFHSTWTLRDPGRPVASIDVVSDLTESAPFLVAITVDP